MTQLLSKQDIQSQIDRIKAEDAERKAMQARFAAWLESQPDDIKALSVAAQHEIFGLMEMAGDGLPSVNSSQLNPPVKCIGCIGCNGSGRIEIGPFDGLKPGIYPCKRCGGSGVVPTKPRTEDGLPR
jgi:hypothetical protein